MLRAATATSGGTDAPAVHVLLDLAVDRGHQRLDLERLLGRVVDDLDARLEVRLGLQQVEQPDAALALDDGADRPVLEADDLRDLGQRADAVQLVDAVDLLLLAGALGDERHRLGCADGAVEGLDAAVAADLQRHDHLGEDDGVAERDERQDLDAVQVVLGLVVGCRGVGDFGCLVVSCHWWSAPSAEAVSTELGLGEFVGESLDIVLIEQIVDPDLADRLELKDDPHAGEVHSLAAGQETNDTNALDVRLAVETEVVSPLRGEESLLLVDPQGSGMAARQLGGDADDVSGAGEIVAARADRV